MKIKIEQIEPVKKRKKMKRTRQEGAERTGKISHVAFLICSFYKKKKKGQDQKVGE